ncbi:hypothetical protein VTL71DRAFT_11222 [Oculimacula yallundae]|uniref:Capsule polysaccharide biosynthesis protein n=1 Tax=Oculimacula yallundae TaxID=86028 RepID=A0ABR4CWS0_9HELO
MSSKFTIPSEFQNDIRYVASKDLRSDAEILTSLTKHVPIQNNSEKNIWTFWHSGVLSMPSWCQRNICNWMRLCGPSWTVRVLDNVPGSPNNALKWAESSEIKLPETFVKGTMDGPYTGPHSADFLRGACLWLYGGVWMDTGIILIRDLDRICWNQLADPSSPFQVSAPLMHTTVLANHFVASRKNDPFIKRWHEIFVHMWEGQTNSTNLIQHPLAAVGATISYEAQEARGFAWEFIVEPEFVAGYVSQVLAWMRLCALEEPNGFNGRDYHAEKILYFDSLEEDWGAETVVGFRGKELFDALAMKTKCDGEERESEEYKLAYRNAWRLLTGSSMQKITHGKNLTKTPALGILWDEEVNEGKDIEEGTFAELLRYGSVHFEQTRESIRYVEGVRPDLVIKKGLLEP